MYKSMIYPHDNQPSNCNTPLEGKESVTRDRKAYYVEMGSPMSRETIRYTVNISGFEQLERGNCSSELSKMGPFS